MPWDQRVEHPHWRPGIRATPARSKPAAAIVVFGLDQANKPRAASFPADQVMYGPTGSLGLGA